MVVRRRLIIYAYTDFAIFTSVLYFSELGQIQHTCAFEVYNMEIKVHFSFDLANAKYNNWIYSTLRHMNDDYFTLTCKHKMPQQEFN